MLVVVIVVVTTYLFPQPVLLQFRVFFFMLFLFEGQMCVDGLLASFRQPRQVPALHKRLHISCEGFVYVVVVQIGQMRLYRRSLLGICIALHISIC